MNWILKLVQSERDRQIFSEGWSYAHDNKHTAGQLAHAASCYASPATTDRLRHWPWDIKWWKPTPENRQRDLIKAMALIMAEIERLDRKVVLETLQKNTTTTTNQGKNK